MLQIDFENVQRRALCRKRGIATALLFAMAAVAGATMFVPNPGFWILLVRASAEAALVGGLADWFAVTALFRRPLGLPIPHTAIVSANKDRIGQGLAAFIERNFLTRELMAARIRSLDPASRLAQWLANPENAEAGASRIIQPLPHLLRAIDDQEIRDFVTKALGEQLRKLDLAPVLGPALTMLTASGFHASLLDQALDTCLDFFDRNEERLEDLVAERRHWWLRKAFDRQVVRTIIHSIKDVLLELRQPESKPRAKLLQAIESRVQAIATSPNDQRRIEEAKIRLLEQPDVQLWLSSVWDKLRGSTIEDLVSPSSKARAGLAAAIGSVGRSLLADSAMRERLNGAVEATLAEFLPWRREFLGLITDVVQHWDTRNFTDRLELAVGSDLQYIRINGTVVGALVGCGLFLAKAALQ